MKLICTIISLYELDFTEVNGSGGGRTGAKRWNFCNSSTSPPGGGVGMGRGGAKLFNGGRFIIFFLMALPSDFLSSETFLK